MVFKRGQHLKSTVTPASETSSLSPNEPLIELRAVTKVYQTAAGGFPALKTVNLHINRGEFVGIIGKSGSGKSTMMNMITGIDRPTSGEVYVGGTAVHRLSEDEMAAWRGAHLGIVFQFFQLLPNLTVLENVTLPMDFCGRIPLRERRKRALQLLERVEMDAHARKLPSALSGGQQQRVAIARALANDPAIIIADEPTGSLDSKTADSVFSLFERLISEGKTVVMVTHDSSLARRVTRTVIIADGEMVNENVVRALPSVTPALMLEITRKAEVVPFPAGAVIIQQGEPGERFYILTSGTAEVTIQRPDGVESIAAIMGPGQYVGEISLFSGRPTAATVRADGPVETLALDKDTFQSLLDESQAFRDAMRDTVAAREEHNREVAEGSVQE